MGWKKKISKLKEHELKSMATKEGGTTKANGTGNASEGCDGD